jgi:hypothetical protein
MRVIRVLAFYVGVLVVLCLDFTRNGGAMTRETLNVAQAGLHAFGLH